MKKKLLLVSHDAYRTGAPILLLNLAGILIQSGLYDVRFIIKNAEGPLIEKFLKFQGTLLWNVSNSSNSSKIDRIRKKLFERTREIELKKILSETDIVISNTLTNGDILPTIKKYFGGIIVSYIHELEIATLFFTTPARLEQVLKISNSFLAPSNAVKNHLISNLKVPSNKINILNYFIPNIASISLTKEECRESLGLPMKGKIIGATGTLDWRKGPDLFLTTAKFFFNHERFSNVVFCWLGGYEGIEQQRLNYEIAKAGLEEKILILNAVDNPEVFFGAIDIFFLTSKEDPYPLVVLEAAHSKVPTICFAEAGGAPEFASENAGLVVPFLDISAASNAIASYLTNPQLLERHGQNAFNSCKEKHQNSEVILSQLNKIIFNEK